MCRMPEGTKVIVLAFCRDSDTVPEASFVFSAVGHKGLDFAELSS
jgi:hypothetical protein